LRVGDIDPFITSLLIANGYSSLLAFKGHFVRKVPEEELITSLENFVKNLPDNSPLLTELKIDLHRKNNFKLAEGEICTILGLMVVMEEICAEPDPFSSSATESQSTTSRTPRSVPISASNAASVTQKTIRKRLGALLDQDDPDVAVVGSRTSSFPFTFKIKCIRCEKVLRVTISQDKRPGHQYNIQTKSYVMHVKGCGVEA
jgi:hypothetical protein